MKLLQCAGFEVTSVRPLGILPLGEGGIFLMMADVVEEVESLESVVEMRWIESFHHVPIMDVFRTALMELMGVVPFPRQIVRAIQESDFNLLSNLYDENAVHIIFGKEQIIGRENVVAWWRTWRARQAEVMNNIISESVPGHLMLDLIGNDLLTLHVDLEDSKITQSHAAKPGGCPICRPPG